MGGTPEAWSEVLRMTDAMLSCAESGAWDELSELERQRRSKLETFFSRPVDPAEAELVREYITELLELDQRIIAMGESAQQALLGEASQITRGRRAETAYRQNSK